MNPKPPINQQPLFQPWLRAVLFLAAYMVLLTLLGVVVFIGMEEGNSLTNLEELYILQIISLLVTCLTVWIFRTYIDKKSVFSLGFEWKKKGRDFAAGFGLGFVILAVGTVILMLLKELAITSFKLEPTLLFSYFFLCVIIALNEEILVRGYILNNLMQSLNKYWALLISAIIFTLFHALNPNISFLAVVNLMLAGILLGIYYIYQQNLWFPIALHTSWNYSEGAIFGYEVSGIDFHSLLQQDIGETDWLTGGEFGFEGSVVLSVLLIGAIWVTHKVYGSNE